jgi:hypothetical protein
VSITPGERIELRSLVKQQFKVLRAEVKARQQELTAEVDHAIVAKHETRDFLRQEVEKKARRVYQDACREIQAALEEAGHQATGRGRLRWYEPHIFWDQDDRTILRRAAVSDLEAKVKAATLRLDRQEVDLLQNLAIGALQSDEARSFLASIPTVAELVPASRLDELERMLGEGAGEAS